MAVKPLRPATTPGSGPEDVAAAGDDGRQPALVHQVPRDLDQRHRQAVHQNGLSLFRLAHLAEDQPAGLPVPYRRLLQSFLPAFHCSLPPASSCIDFSD